MSTYNYVRASGVRKLVKREGKRCGRDFLAALDKYIYEKVLSCCRAWNGHKVTLNGGLAEIILHEARQKGKKED